MVNEALKQASSPLPELDAVAVTYAQGLSARAACRSQFCQRPCGGRINCLSGASYSWAYCGELSGASDLKPPFLCLVVSGGHSHIIEVQDYTRFHVIGRTHDDAVGESV